MGKHYNQEIELVYHNLDEPHFNISRASMRYLESILSDKDFVVTFKLMNRINSSANNIESIGTTARSVAEALNENRNNILSSINRLEALNIIARDPSNPKFWIFNPYIAQGQYFINTRTVHNLFKDSKFFKLCYQDKIVNEEMAIKHTDNIYILAQEIPEGIIYKLGYSENINKRLQTYYYHNPSIKLLKTFYIDNGKEFELNYHKNNVSAYKNEWYFTNPLEFVENYLQNIQQ